MIGMSFNILAVIISAIFLTNDLRKNDKFVDGIELMDKPKDKQKDKLLDDPNSVPNSELSTSLDQQISDQNPDHVPKSGRIWIFRPSMLVGDS